MPEPTDSAGEVLAAIVGLGASAGGMAALKEFFSAMPPKTGIAFVVVMHLDPDSPSMLPELLAGLTGFTVMEAAENQTIEPDHVYIIPPGKNLLLDAAAGAVGTAHVYPAHRHRHLLPLAGRGPAGEGRGRGALRRRFRRGAGHPRDQGPRRPGPGPRPGHGGAWRHAAKSPSPRRWSISCSRRGEMPEFLLRYTKQPYVAADAAAPRRPPGRPISSRKC